MRYIYLFISLLISSVAFAQLEGNGYYRVKSAQTKRFLFLMDKSGEINVSSASADVAAIVPYFDIRENSKGKDVVSDPATVIFVQSISGGYKFSGQGVSTTDIIGNYPIQILDRGSNTYWCYASKSGTTMYLADTQTSSRYPNGTLQTIGPSEDATGNLRKWIISPVSSTSDNYFGVKPTFSCGGKYYASFYVDFPFSLVSSGMKVYTVTKNKKDKAALVEISGVIPAKTPVLIECSSDDPANNKLNIGGNAGSGVNNILKGNFFCYDPNPNRTGEPHENLTPVTSTMRVFGVTSIGKLGLVTPSDLTNLPANCAYFDAAGLDAELVLMSEDDYNNSDVVAVESVALNQTSLSLEVGQSVTLVATVNPDNATDKAVTWKSSDESVVTVENGVVKAVSAGTADITVTTNNGKTATCKVTVKNPVIDVASVSLNKAEITLTVGDTETLVATVNPDNATDKAVTWKSSDESVVTVENGVVKAVSAGTADITVTTNNGKTAICKVTVKNPVVDVTSVSLNKAEITLTVGDTETLVATVNPDNATDKAVTWKSSDESVVTVENGVVKAVSAGTADVTVTTNNGKTATCKVTVKNPVVDVTSVSLNKAEITLTVGDTETLVATVNPDNATDKAVTWKSSDESVVTVENGVVKAVSAGTADVTVTTNNGKTATCKVTVENPVVDVTSVSLNKTELTLYLANGANSETLIASIAPENATDKTLTWSSNNTDVATVEDGVVTAVAVGTAVITVKSANGIEAICTVTVEEDAAVEGIFVDSVCDTAIYTIAGQYVGRSVETLGKGVYIINGKKVVIK